MRIFPSVCGFLIILEVSLKYQSDIRGRMIKRVMLTQHWVFLKNHVGRIIMLFLEYVAHLGTINNSLVYQIEKLTVYKSMNFETVETFDKALKEKK